MTTAVARLFRPNEERLRRLRRMKRTAAALLLAALAVFVASYLVPWSGQGDQFLRAASEAAMVGGLADWFAVTALFRRPLGLPIPHTALIPTKKDDLASTLGSFLTEHFLGAGNLAAHLESVDLLGIAGRWLAEPTHARAVGGQVLRLAGTALESVPTDSLTRAAVGAVRRDMDRRSYAARLGEVVELAVTGDAYEPFVAAAFVQAAAKLRDPALAPMLTRIIENAGWLSWLWVTDKRSARLLERAADLLEESVLDHTRPPWPQQRDLLLRVATTLQEDNPTSRAADAALRQQLDDPALRAWVTDLLDGGLAVLRASADDPESDLAVALTAALGDAGKRAQHDPAFRSRARELLDRTVLSRIEANPEFFIGFITETVARWDAEDTSRRIEVAVGRDLQFIRINGTVVGAAAGVAIHAMSLVL